ncbi:copper-binding protein [Roseateles sp. NT4]|uniref:copper-binding protein n=1 Tax=Roseateles sp. NT4 TaxID=3453715 RepID=UPI003EECCE23
MKLTHILAIASLATAFGATAQTAPASAADRAAQQSASTAAPQSDGEVRKVDLAQGKVTLRHGPLENLGMPAMTMVFKVADPKMLDSLKDGDKVKFTAEKVNGAFTVTAIQPAK